MGGGSSGIGHATAERLAAEGHQVMITGRRVEALDTAVARLRKRTSGVVNGVVGDVADLDSAEAVVEAAEAKYGAVDVLVLNAGGPPPGRILDIDDERWQDAFDLLLRGPLRLARRVLPGMAKRGFGRIVFVTSTVVRQPQPDLAASVVLRAGVHTAAKLLAAEHAVDGVTVNCVAPGATATERRKQIFTSRAKITGMSYDDIAAVDAARIPAGRPGEPEEVAAAIAFLCSAAASYVNGTVLTVDGGRTETI